MLQELELSMMMMNRFAHIEIQWNTEIVSIFGAESKNKISNLDPICISVSTRKSLETGEKKKSLKIMNFSRDFSFLLFLDTFENGKCLETGETTIP